MKGALDRLGGAIIDRLDRTGRMGLLLAACTVKALTPPWRLGQVWRQLHFIGARSLTVVVCAGLFTGMVVALQFHDTLVRFGSVNLLGSAVGLSLIRELGPVLTALMVVGRAGSAICAEIGIMRSAEQIDALECMAIDPERFLLAPRLMAGVIAMPLLVAVFDVVGIAGGWFVGVVLFDLGHGAYMQGMASSVAGDDVAMGVVKSLVFGVLALWVALGKGYFLHLDREGAFGAEGVSRVTTEAVVLASIGVLLADYLISAIMV